MRRSRFVPMMDSLEARWLLDAETFDDIEPVPVVVVVPNDLGEVPELSPQDDRVNPIDFVPRED